MKCKDGSAPCLHAPCIEAQGVRCCSECQAKEACSMACFRAKEVQHDDSAGEPSLRADAE